MNKGSTHYPSENTKALVLDKASHSVAHKSIAKRLDICLDTLHKYYQNELDLGRIEAEEACTSALAKSIAEGNMTAVIFALKAQHGWSTVSIEGVTSTDTVVDDKIITQVNIKIAGVNDDNT